MSKVSVAMSAPSRGSLDGERESLVWFLRRVVDEQLDAKRAALTVLVAQGYPAPVLAVRDYAECVQEAERIEADPVEWAREQWIDGPASGAEQWALDRATQYRKDAEHALDRIMGRGDKGYHVCAEQHQLQVSYDGCPVHAYAKDLLTCRDPWAGHNSERETCEVDR